MADLNINLDDEAATLDFAAGVARACRDGAVIYLHGNLGAGKTTFARGFLRALGVTGHIKSPTFAVVEPYELAGRSAAHFDLYRINDPDELNALGVREYFTPGAWVLVEWPERGQGILPTPDLDLEFNYHGGGRTVTGRAMSVTGQRVMDTMHRSANVAASETGRA